MISQRRKSLKDISETVRDMVDYITQPVGSTTTELPGQVSTFVFISVKQNWKLPGNSR